MGEASTLPRQRTAISHDDAISLGFR